MYLNAVSLWSSAWFRIFRPVSHTVVNDARVLEARPIRWHNVMRLVLLSLIFA